MHAGEMACLRDPTSVWDGAKERSDDTSVDLLFLNVAAANTTPHHATPLSLSLLSLALLSQLKPFRSLLGVMLHEITHVSIGLEDIHPPAFYALLAENKELYFKLRGQIVSTKGGVGVDREILDSDDALDGPASIKDFKGECGARRSWSGRHSQGTEGRRIVDRALGKGEKKRPLKKGKK